MGQSLMKLFFDNSCQKEVKVAMLGLDAAGKTTILHRLHVGEVLSTVPTIGFNVEKVNVAFTVWDVGGQDKLRPLWRHYLSNSDALIYVVDSTDRDRIGVAREEFQAIVKDPLILSSILLVLANKQDMVIISDSSKANRGRQRLSSVFGVPFSSQKGAMSPSEVEKNWVSDGSIKPPMRP
ncbi:unnamed protein product [Miscanthus lutarioriparius]|uniref:ADP-ribosylation factor n=1 Tax=Miscanthus lutarioriparius TaxID=422564 RepID=A0A811S7A2_9POAL|nr:unnamed protein product [Miscanthus lutarioriparius]